MENNQNIISELSKLANHEKLTNNFRYRAYKNAINIIEQFPDPITSSSQLLSFKGIGKSISQKIDEIITFGYLKEQPTLTPQQQTINIFTTIYGIGTQKANDLYNQGITTLQLLKENQHLLNNKQLIGLKYHHHLIKRIPRQEMLIHHKQIKNLWLNPTNNIEKNFQFEIVGSYRRQAETSGDIDILLTYKPLTNSIIELIQLLKTHHYIIETLAEGPKKFMGICKLPNLPPRRIDILYTPPHEYPFAILYFTGSDKYNRNMREHAQRHGYKLNEKGITTKKQEEIPNLKNEEDILNFFHLPYLQPHERTGPLYLS